MLHTADGEKLFAWHVLPTAVYLKHEAELQGQPSGRADRVESTAAFRALRNDPDARVVISCKTLIGPPVFSSPSMILTSRRSPWSK